MIHELGQWLQTGLGILLVTALLLVIAVTVVVPTSPYLLLVLLLIGAANSELKPRLAEKQLIALLCATIPAIIAPALVVTIAKGFEAEPGQSLWTTLIVAIYLPYAALLTRLWLKADKSEKYGILLFWTTGAYLIACIAYVCIEHAKELMTP